MANKRISVTAETPTGRNVSYKDNRTGESMTRPQFVKKIEQGLYPDYHTRTIHKIKTPCSNPDGKPGNNLN
ncbi:MAG: hypothetical protein WCR78_07430 [Arcobacteraceae bacterium]